MLFWICAAAMTAGVLALILTPLVRPRQEGGSRAAYDLEVYRDQLGELDRDLARGVINEAQAAAARAEIGRRMLAVADQGTAQPTPGGRHAMVLAIILALTIPLGALAVYLPLGRPDAPAQPLASRQLDQERNAPPEDVLAAMENLRRQLDENPGDAQGWAILGRAYAKMGRLDAASDALRKAVALSPDDPDLLGAHGEVLIGANGGIVTEEARAAYDRVLEKRPEDPRARFYAGLARFQAGDLTEALERWRALMAESPANAPWVPTVRDHIRQAAEGLGRDPDGAVPSPLPPLAENQEAPRQAPSPENRDRMIRDMVEGLATRLEADPSDLDGWVRLARSYAVLGEGDKAVEAARKAKELAPDRADILVSYATALLTRDSASTDGQQSRPMPEEAVEALKRALAVEPQNREALWLLGMDAAGTGRAEEASDLWNRLLAQFQPGDPEYASIRARIDALKAGG
jgi:cytochrome c-type biogenesis protein CcmH